MFFKKSKSFLLYAIIRLLYALYILFYLFVNYNSSCLLFLSTVLSDEDTGPPNQDDEQDPPAGMVEIAAAGGYMKGIRDKRVVRWDPGGRNVRAGPGIIHIIFIMSIMRIIRIIFVLSGARFYESQRKKAGAHLFFNAFWLIPHFCINLMYLRDTMHRLTVVS